MGHYIIPIDFIQCEDEDFSYEVKRQGNSLMDFYNKNILPGKIINDEFQYRFGAFHTNRIKEGSYFLIFDPPILESKSFGTEEEYIKFMNDKNGFTHYYYGAAQIFSLCLWLIKDNSINIRFGIYHSGYYQGGGLQVIKNGIVSNSKGEHESEIFQKKDFEKANEWFEFLSEYYFTEVDETEARKYNTYNNLSSDVSHNTNSFKRALSYLEQARSTSFLPAKIASYISVLENLFVVSDSNTYKTPERTAVFLGGTKEERSSNFKIVKDSYSVRSSYVHGSNISKRHNNNLPVISDDLDKVVRKVLIKFFTEFKHLNHSGNEHEKVNEYFVDLVLGGV
ncbi:HEPN domain-containing protein [Bacillus thuringiensis]|uniref:HEPN domain-containing protein n=1 Tax=Bacillus basilensis TaxID=3243721 RepID=UPI001E61055F|nr:HEPN domain-containing protein [Bacillus sp. (in: firmicutes)]